MEFQAFWSQLQTNLKPGSTIRNWTAARNYLGDEFRIFSISSSCVEVDAPKADTIQRVSKKDFELMFNHWNAYCSGKMPRKSITDKSRVSKYTMSILKHLNV